MGGFTAGDCVCTQKNEKSKFLPKFFVANFVSKNSLLSLIVSNFFILFLSELQRYNFFLNTRDVWETFLNFILKII